ncbi:MAG TPA: hypothetical protein DCL74_04460 [Succinivibrionaceae bacterium]|nr:hypothetical protein [Succinivibrionaceae bacterium]
MAHTVVRTDMLAGTVNPAFLENGRYKKSNAYEKIDNGSIVMVGALEDGERESHVYSDVPAGTSIDKLVLIAVPEIFKDTSVRKDIRDFEVAAGVVSRGYRLTPGGEFSITADGIDGSPTKGATVGLAANTHKLKVSADDTKIGTIADVEVKKFMTFYTIKITE